MEGTTSSVCMCVWGRWGAGGVGVGGRWGAGGVGGRCGGRGEFLLPREQAGLPRGPGVGICTEPCPEEDKGTGRPFTPRQEGRRAGTLPVSNGRVTGCSGDRKGL